MGGRRDSNPLNDSAVQMIIYNSLGIRKNIKFSDCEYATWTQGMGHPVVLLHGWPVTSLHWRRVVPGLVESGFKTICIDLRGLGLSRAGNGNFEKENLALEIQEVINTIIGDKERFSLVGHDWGGSIGIVLAKTSGRVDAIVIEEEIPPGICTTLPEPGVSRYPNWHGNFHRQKPLAETLIKAKQREYFQFWLDLRADPALFCSEEADQFLQAYDDPNKISLFLEYYRTHNKDSDYYIGMSLHPLTVPALALGGKFAMGLRVAESTRQLFLNTDLFVFDHSGHYPAQEEPELFVQKVVPFLKKM